MFAKVFKYRFNFPIDLVANRSGKKHLSRIAQPLDSRGDIYAIAMNIVIFDNHITNIDPDAESNLSFF